MSAIILGIVAFAVTLSGVALIALLITYRMLGR